MSIVGLLVLLIVVGVLFWAVKALSGAFGIPPPVVVVIQVILVLLVVLYLAQQFLGANSLPFLRLR